MGSAVLCQMRKVLPTHVVLSAPVVWRGLRRVNVHCEQSITRLQSLPDDKGPSFSHRRQVVLRQSEVEYLEFLGWPGERGGHFVSRSVRMAYPVAVPRRNRGQDRQCAEGVGVARGWRPGR